MIGRFSLLNFLLRPIIGTRQVPDFKLWHHGLKLLQDQGHGRTLTQRIAAPSDAQALDVWEDRDGKMFRFFRDVPVSAKPDSAGRLRGLKKL